MMENNGSQFNKKRVYIPLSSNAATDGDVYITGEFAIHSSPKPRALMIFAHGSGSGRDSPRNQYVAKTNKEHNIIFINRSKRVNI